MVLHKSKWDHKAKVQYLRKHGLTLPRPKQETQPKWTSKKSAAQKPQVLDDSDSEWDSEDDALINHFFPDLGEQSLAVEHKRKLKRLIVSAIVEREGAEHEQEEAEEPEGIYLGTRPEAPEAPETPAMDKEEAFEIPDLETKLSEFMLGDWNKPKPRKLLKNKILDNLLDDYGLDSYASTVKSNDYNAKSAKTLAKQIDRLTSDDLHGFRIGDKLGQQREVNVRTLSEEEQQEHTERAEKLARAKLYAQIKNTFGDDKLRAKVLEINNINPDDERAMATLNLKLTQTARPASIDDDLEELLGFSDQPSEPLPEDNLDELLGSAALSATKNAEVKRQAPKMAIAKDDEAFLDDLLG